MSIFDVRHQGRVHRLIQRALAGKRFPHAYIFCGPDGVGKEMFALRLAKVMLCEEPIDATVDLPELQDWSGPTRDACGRCRSCHLLDVDNHPDLHLVYRQLNVHHPDTAVRNRKAINLGVDVIRHFVIDLVGVKPTCGNVKIFVIREADRLAPAAQNALLKTLEEPPPTTFLFLLTASLEGLLGTTRSRCQLIDFAPLPQDFVMRKTAELGEDVSDDEAALYATWAQGSLGGALAYAQDNLIALNEQVVNLLKSLTPTVARESAASLQEAAKELSAGYRKRNRELSDTDALRKALRAVFLLMAQWYRDKLHALAGTTGTITGATTGTAKTPPTLSAGSFNLESATEALSTIAETERRIGLSANTQLCLDNLMFKLARCDGMRGVTV